MSGPPSICVVSITRHEYLVWPTGWRWTSSLPEVMHRAQQCSLLYLHGRALLTSRQCGSINIPKDTASFAYAPQEALLV